MRHIIPVNVSQDGGWFGGMLKKRNTLEAVIVFMLGLLVCFGALKFLPLIPRLVIFFLVFVVPAAIALIGINDQSAMEYVVTSIKYRRARDIIPYLIQTENAPEESLSIAQKVEQTLMTNKESKRQEKKGKNKAKEDKNAQPKKSRKARKKERKERKAELKERKRQNKRRMKEAKKALKRGEAFSFDPDNES